MSASALPFPHIYKGKKTKQNKQPRKVSENYYKKTITQDYRESLGLVFTKLWAALICSFYHKGKENLTYSEKPEGH